MSEVVGIFAVGDGDGGSAGFVVHGGRGGLLSFFASLAVRGGGGCGGLHESTEFAVGDLGSSGGDGGCASGGVGGGGGLVNNQVFVGIADGVAPGPIVGAGLSIVVLAVLADLVC